MERGVQYRISKELQYRILGSGWMETYHFYAWVVNHFVKQIPPKCPVDQMRGAVEQVLPMSDCQVKAVTQNCPGKTWWYGFLRRHPSMHMIKPTLKK